jgi:hypothetical protein
MEYLRPDVALWFPGAIRKIFGHLRALKVTLGGYL